MPYRPAPHDSRRCAVTSITRPPPSALDLGQHGGVGAGVGRSRRRTVSKSASTTVLPVTTTVAGSTPSSSRAVPGLLGRRQVEVGQLGDQPAVDLLRVRRVDGRRCAAQPRRGRPGSGGRSRPARRPSSWWCRPGPRARRRRAGRAPRRSAGHARPARSVRLCPATIRSRSTSGADVVQSTAAGRAAAGAARSRSTTGSHRSRGHKADTTGASLIASGRVPSTTPTRRWHPSVAGDRQHRHDAALADSERRLVGATVAQRSSWMTALPLAVDVGAGS